MTRPDLRVEYERLRDNYRMAVDTWATTNADEAWESKATAEDELDAFMERLLAPQSGMRQALERIAAGTQPDARMGGYSGAYCGSIARAALNAGDLTPVGE